MKTFKQYFTEATKKTITIYKNHFPVEAPFVYIRFGDLPEGGNPSMNWLSGKREMGISVYRAWFDPIKTKYILEPPEGETDLGEYIGTQDSFSGSSRPAYILDGDELPEHGADLEPLLNPNSVSIIKKVSFDDIVTLDDPTIAMNGKELADGEVPTHDNEPTEFKFPEGFEHQYTIRQNTNGKWLIYNGDDIDLRSGEYYDKSGAHRNMASMVMSDVHYYIRKQQR
tara:strand:- start:108 stop:785 length:678 start_codon:yes stop_codon:yes gene_type:complete